jgi:hypothetical protein
MTDGNEILEALDNLVQLGSETALHYGWLACEYFDAEKGGLVSEFGTEAAALHECISFLHERQSQYIAARSTVADRMRVCRWMDRQKYTDLVDEVHYKPSFHQLRACLMTENGDVLADESDALLNWCVEHEWPSVAEIRDARMGVENVTPENRRWKRLVKMAGVVGRDITPSGYTGRIYACNVVMEQDNNEARYAP